MKISSRIEESLCGTIFSNRRALSSSTRFAKGWRSTFGSQLSSRQRRQGERPRDIPKHRHAELPFSCPWVPPPVLVKSPHTSRTGEGASRLTSLLTTKRWSHSGAQKEKEKERTGDVVPHDFFLNKQELLSLVDQGQEGAVDDHLEFIRDPYLRGYAQADGPEVTVSERDDDKEFPSFSEVRGGEDERRTLAKLWRAIQRRLSNPYKTDIDSIYKLYQELPEPRMPYLHARIRHSFMRCLGREKKTSKSMLRYFAVVADIQISGLRLTRSEWNSALSFAARHVGHSTETETAAALNLWKEMEQDAGIKGNHVTFNILYDVASKSGNFVLAEMLYKEMEKRGLEYNRYHHVSLIHFFGLKMDSGGLRAAYKEMVEAGEMIDTTVLNCVIAGLLRCGEEYAAERVYERMKAAHERAPAMPFRNYMNDRVITKVLMMFAKISKGDVGLRRQFQKISPIVPNIQTYRILLNHYGVKLAALDKVAHYLDDMKWFQIPLHGTVFLALFKGFAIYGGHKGKAQVWSSQRLENVWSAFRQALQENAHGLYVNVWMAKWILRAFRHCESEERTWEVWHELRPWCDMDFEPEDEEHFEEFLVGLFKDDGNAQTYRDRGMFGVAGGYLY